MEINIYTDGSTKGNGTENAIGGWSYIIIIKKEVIQIELKQSCQVYDTTNNRMELIAIIEAINRLNWVLDNDKEIKVDKINIYTDSAYIQNCYSQQWYTKWENNGWINSKKEPVKNKDLWLQLIPYFKNNDFCFLKVKGHNGDTYNEIADYLAQDAAIGLTVDKIERYIIYDEHSNTSIRKS